MGNAYGTTKVIWMNERFERNIKIDKNAQVFFKKHFRQDTLPYKILIRGMYAGKNKSDYVIIVKFKSRSLGSSAMFKRNIVLDGKLPIGLSKSFHKLAGVIKHNPHAKVWTLQMLQSDQY